VLKSFFLLHLVGNPGAKIKVALGIRQSLDSHGEWAARASVDVPRRGQIENGMMAQE
jgi:hypothetical protein